jgi:hypothetical protein
VVKAKSHPDHRRLFFPLLASVGAVGCLSILVIAVTHNRFSSPKRNRGFQLSTITPIGIWECFAVISLDLYLDTARLVIPDLKPNQADEGQPSKEKPTQSSDHYDKK